MDPRRPTNDHASTSFGIAPNVVALCAAMIPLMSGLAFLVLERRNRFVRFHAMQSVLLGIVVIGGYAVLWAVRLVAVGHNIALDLALVFLWVVFVFLWLSAWGFGMLGAALLANWEIPWIGRRARALLARLDTRLDTRGDTREAIPESGRESGD